MYLTDDQEAFRADLRSYLEENVEPVVDEADEEPFTRDEMVGYLKDLEELGIGFSPDTVEEFFGDMRQFAIVSEEVSYYWPSLNVGLLMSFPAQFVRWASQETRTNQLSKLETGECIGSLAVSEPEGGSDTAQPDTVAHKEGDEYVLEGGKTWVGNAPIADVSLVVAHDEENDMQDMFLVDREYSDYEADTINKMGWKAVNNGRMYLDGVRVPEDNKLSAMISNALRDGHGLTDVVPFPDAVAQLFFDQKALNATFSFMRTGMSFMSVGIMQAAHDEALEYVHERETFGSPISDHQLVQELLYDIRTDLETSRQLSRRALEALENGEEDARLLSSMAKGYTAERAVDATSDAIQVMGGEGLKTENRLERYFRDARTMPIPDGTTEIQKLIVGKEMTGRSAYK